MVKRWRLVLVITLGLLAGCSTEEPAPALVDPTRFVTYANPTGVFTLSLPPDWIVSDTSSSYALNVEFSPPNSPEPLMGVYVVSAGIGLAALPTPSSQAGEATTADQAAIDRLITVYEQTFYLGADSVYRELARESQPDGSVRLKLLVSQSGKNSAHNDFAQIIGPYFVVLRARLPDDVAQLRTVGKVINTLSVNQTATWASSVGAGGGASKDAVGFASLNGWVDRNGGFEIAGQVFNNATNPLEFVQIAAQLYDAQDRVVAEQDDFVSSDLVLPGQYAPFSLVFHEGLPPGAVRYELHASARYADASLHTFYGPENFAAASESRFDENGFLVVSGQVRNQGNLKADLVKVIATIFDDQKRVIATDTALVDAQTLAPGEISPFKVTFVELGGTAATFTVVAQGVIGQ
jgi:hypothetical protein